jgi:hypothetical protein
MTRQERRLLNKSRQTSSWLVVLCIILGIWIKYKYDDVSYAKMDLQGARQEISEYQRINGILNLKLDSINKASIKHIDTTPVAVKPIYKPKAIKVDTVIPKDSIKPVKKDSIK